MLGVMRDSGKYTSKRNEELKRIENAIRSVKDPHALTDDELRGLANAYTRMKFGVSNDPDGRRRYNENKPMSGKDYFKRVANEIDPNRYADEFPNQLGAYGNMSRDEQLAWADKKIKDQRTLSQKLGMAKFDDPKYIELTERTPREQDELIELGRGIALQESYVPMRKFMESKLGRNRFALDTARKAVETGRLSIDALNIMSKEEAGFVSSYVSQFRPYDTKQGFFPAIGEATRRVVVGTLDSGEKFGKFIAGFGVDASLGLYENWNPIDGASFAEEFRRVKSLKRQSEAATAWKAAPRNRFGTAVMGLADTIPFMIEVMASPATAIVAAGSVAEETRTRLMDMEGVDPTSARVAGVFSGATAVLVERLTGFAGRGKLAEALSKSVITKTASKRLSMQLMNVLARGGEKFIRTGTGEIFEEGIEGFVNSIIEDLSKHELPSVRNATAELIDQMDASKDVIALMSALGLMGRAVTSPFRQSISQSGAEVDVNNRSLQRFSENIANELESDPEMAKQAAEDINGLIIDTWVSEPNKDVAKARLEESGVTVTPELVNDLELIEAQILEVETEEASQIEATKGEIDEARKAVLEENERLGIPTTLVDTLTGTADPENAAQFREDGGIEIANYARDPIGLNRHEQMHGAIAYGKVSQAELAVLKESNSQEQMNEVTRAYAKDLADGKIDKDGLSEEAISERYRKFRELPQQEKTILKKLLDFVTRLRNLVKHGTFKTAEDIFGAIEGRFESTAGDARVVKGGAFGKEARTRQDVIDFAARTLYTRARLTEENAQKIIDRFGVDGVSAAEVVAEADQLQDIARKDFGATVGEAFSIADIRRAGIRRRTMARIKQIRKTGRAEGRTLERARARLESQKKAKKQKERLRASTEATRTQEQELRDRGIPQSGANNSTLREKGAMTLDADTMFDTVDKHVSDAIGDMEVKPTLRQNIMRASLGKAMRALLNKFVPAKDRLKLSRKIDKFAKPRASASKDMESQFRELMVDLNAVATKTKIETIKTQFNRAIKRLLTKRNKAAHQELAGRTIAPDELNIVRAYEKATGMSMDEAKILRVQVETLLDLDASEGDGNVEDSRTEVLKAFPSLKDMSDSEVGQIALRAVDIYSSMDAMNEAEAQSAMDDLMDFIQDAKNNLHAQLLERRKEVERVKDLLRQALDLSINEWGTQGKFATFDYADPFTMIDEIFRDLPEDHPAKPLSLELEKELNKARRDTASEVEAFNLELREKIQEIYTQKEIRDIDKPRDDLAQFDIDKNPISLRNLMLTVINLRQPDVQERAEKRPNSDLGKQMKMLPEMQKKLGLKEQALMDWMVKRIDNEYDRLAAKYKQITGSTLSRVELYFPLTQEASTPAGYNEFHGGGVGVIRGFLKHRIDSTRRIQTSGDVVGRMSEHMADVYRFLNYADIQIKLRDTFFSKSIKDKLREAWGKENLDDLRSSLITEFMGRSAVKGKPDKWVRNAMSLMIHMALDGNILSAGRQLVDIFSVGAKMGADYANYLMNPAQWKETYSVTRELMKDPKVKAMLAEGGAPQYQIQMRGFLDKYLSGSKTARLAKTLIGIVPAADSLSRLLAIGAAYRAAMNMPDIAAMQDPKERKQAALDRAILRLEQTLQSPHVADRPRAAREAGSLAKLMTVFTSALTPKIAQTLQEFRSLKRKGFTNKAAQKGVLKKLLYYHVVGGSMQFSVAFLAGLLLDDDEDWWDGKDTAMLALNIATGPFAGWFLFGPMADALGRASLGLPTYERSPLGLLSQSITSAGRVSHGYIKQTFTDQDYEEVNKKAMDTLLRMSAPGRLTKKALEKYLEY